MPSATHKKVKERIALALRIENLNKEAEPCSRCRRNSRRCLVDLKESPRCSECVRSKRACNSSGPKVPCPFVKRVCRFFIGPMRRKVPSNPVVESPLTWFPAFELDFVALGISLGSTKELPDLPPFDPADPF